MYICKDIAGDGKSLRDNTFIYSTFSVDLFIRREIAISLDVALRISSYLEMVNLYGQVTFIYSTFSVDL